MKLFLCITFFLFLKNSKKEKKSSPLRCLSAPPPRERSDPSPSAIIHLNRKGEDFGRNTLASRSLFRPKSVFYYMYAYRRYSTVREAGVFFLIVRKEKRKIEKLNKFSHQKRSLADSTSHHSAHMHYRAWRSSIKRRRLPAAR